MTAQNKPSTYFATRTRLSQAIAMHQAGELGNAERLYRAILDDEPGDIDALRLLAILIAGTGRQSEGLNLLSRALKINPNHPESLAAMAQVLQAFDKYDLARTYYKRAADADGNNADILFNYANLLARQGADKKAETIYARALKIKPEDPDFLINYGNVLRSQDKLDGALEAYRKAKAQAPERADALANEAAILIDQDQLPDALVCCDRSLELDPDQPDAWNNKGNVHARLGEKEEALAAFEKALEFGRTNPAVLINHGNAAVSLGKHKEAVTSYKDAIRLENRNPQTFLLLAVALENLKQYKEAIGACQFALKNKADFPEAQNLIAQAYLAQEKWNDAIEGADKALAMKKGYPDALFNKGMALLGGRRYAEGVDIFLELLDAVGPDDNMVLLNFGNALLGAGRARDAIDAFIKTVEKMPTWSGGFLNLGHAYMNDFQFDTAIKTYHRGLELEPENAQLKYSIGNVFLHLGQFDEGWKGYEHRWKTPDGLQAEVPDIARWQGEDLDGKSIVVIGEQGLGDNIQMARYFSVLKKRGATKVAFSGYKLLHALLGSVADHVEFIDEISDRKFDYQVPVMSLPYAAGTSVDNIPAELPLLRARPADIERWGERIGNHGFKIGINWQGSPLGLVDAGRSAPLKKFLPVASLPGVRLISMQKNHGLDQLDSLPEGMRVETLGDDFDTSSDAFLDTVAVMANLDMVITTDTSMAHVAGGMGVPVWLALKRMPDWRWLLNRADSPWYPMMRLFRQVENAEWDSVFASMAAELPSLMKPAA